MGPSEFYSLRKVVLTWLASAADGYSPGKAMNIPEDAVCKGTAGEVSQRNCQMGTTTMASGGLTTDCEKRILETTDGRSQKLVSIDTQIETGRTMTSGVLRHSIREMLVCRLLWVRARGEIGDSVEKE